MTITELRQKFLDFFQQQAHVILPSASLMPENDPTTLFTGSGMQPMLPYLLGETHPLGRRFADSQKCFRAQDIEEVGDNRHTTFFEMLGNWSLGDYFKEEQVAWMFTFLTNKEIGLGLDPARLYVTVFRGDESLNISRDAETVELWKKCFSSVGVQAKDVNFAERDGMADGRIFYYDVKKNWWSRSGVPANMPLGEPGGPDTEMFWDFGADRQLHERSEFRDRPCHVNCDCGRFVEIGNNVFMQYRKTSEGFDELVQRNVDFGGGLERMAAATQDDPDVFRTSAFLPVIAAMERISGKMYDGSAENTRSFRIIADHVRGATFIVGDPQNVLPSNVGQGYVVRRLLRRAIREARRLEVTRPFISELAQVVIEQFGDAYPELKAHEARIIEAFQKEEIKFASTLTEGLKKLQKMGHPTGEQAFILFSTYGFPLELTEEIVREQGTEIDRAVFQEEFKKHQALSRTSSAGTFKGGLADHSIETTRLHTATHLLHRALKTVLGEHVEQRGSNITPERLRFDFSHGQKMTPEEIQNVEEIINDVIRKDLPVHFEEMTVDEAKSHGVIGLFEDKYAQIGNKVKVYFVGDDAQGFFSKEICGGPHVMHTGELGLFKIQKEEAVSAGVRRIKATVTGI